MATEVNVGDYFTVASGGFTSWLIRHATNAPVNHAGVYIGKGQILEAQPGGAVLSPVNKYGKRANWARVPLTKEQQRGLRLAGLATVGRPYNWFDIFVLGYTRVFEKATPKWMKRWLGRSDRLICSQLVDFVHRQVDSHLFTDDRLTGEVTPGDLYFRGLGVVNG